MILTNIDDIAVINAKTENIEINLLLGMLFWEKYLIKIYKNIRPKIKLNNWPKCSAYSVNNIKEPVNS